MYKNRIKLLKGSLFTEIKAISVNFDVSAIKFKRGSSH